MTRIAVLIVAATSALALASSAMSATPKLRATVGPGNTILLVRGSARVRTLKAGTYLIVVSDRSRVHNFRLRGPRLDAKLTGLKFVGRKLVVLKLERGRYTYLCDRQRVRMRRFFRVV